MITVQEILDKSKTKEEISPGCWSVCIRLREIATGNNYVAKTVYTEGKYQGFVEVMGKLFLVSPRNFEFLD